MTPRGGSAWSGGFSLPGGGLPGPGGFSLPGPGGCLPGLGGVCLVRGGGQGLSGEPPPPVDRITDTCKNITLATTSVRPVMKSLRKAVQKL